MRPPRLLSTLAAYLCAISSLPAWNGTGHMTVASIAYQQLSPEDRSKLAALLAQHPDHDRLARGIPTGNKELVQLTMFVRAATWPDDIRSDKRFYDDTNKHATPTPIPTGFPDLALFPEGTNKVHKNWHFINEPLGGDDLDTLTPFDDHGAFRSAPTILTKIADLRTALQTTGTPALVRAYELPWLIHLVGDVHQPLHTVAHVLGKRPDGTITGDLGGNSVVIASFQNSTIAKPVTNLHSFWDDSLGQATDITTITSLSASLSHLHPKPTTDPIALQPEAWFTESATAAITVVYKDLAGATTDANGQLVIPDGYFDTANALSGERVAKAGYRLAAVLHDVLRKQ